MFGRTGARLLVLILMGVLGCGSVEAPGGSTGSRVEDAAADEPAGTTDDAGRDIGQAVADAVSMDAPPTADASSASADAALDTVADAVCGALDDPKNCGACGHDCAVLPNVRRGATIDCKAGVCVVPANSCIEGFGHCTANANDGCETRLDTDANCGACNATCTFSNATSTCVSRSCTAPVCKDSFANCETASPDCETDLRVSANNCGRCGHSCLGGKCEDRTCRAVELRSGTGGSPVIDGDYVYFRRSVQNRPAISRMRKDGSDLRDIEVLDAGASFYSMVATKRSLYWRDHSTKEIVSCSLPDCAGGPRVVAKNQQESWELLFTDPAREVVFWGTYDSLSQTGRILKNPESPSVVVVRPGWIAGGATDGVFVYFENGKQLYKVPTGGGDVTPLGPKINSSFSPVVAVNSRDVFFTDKFSDAGGSWPAVYKVPTSGGSSTLVGYYRGGSGSLFQGMVVDESHVYSLVTDYVIPNRFVHLVRCPVTGCSGSATDLANPDGSGDGSGMASDETAVYWGITVSGAILKIAK